MLIEDYWIMMSFFTNTKELYQISLNKIPINYRKNRISPTDISPNTSSRKTLVQKEYNLHNSVLANLFNFDSSHLMIWKDNTPIAK